MQHVELFSGVLSGVEHDGVLTTWVVIQELGDVVDLVVEDNPTVVLSAVLGNISFSESLSGGRSGGGWLAGCGLGSLSWSLGNLNGWLERLLDEGDNISSGDSSVDDTIQQGVSSQSIFSVSSSRNFTDSPQIANPFVVGLSDSVVW